IIESVILPACVRSEITIVCYSNSLSPQGAATMPHVKAPAKKIAPPPTPPSATLVEKIPTTVYNSAAVASQAVAQDIADLIREKAARGEMTVLGLATGSTPTAVYAELVRMHKEEGLS